MLINLWPWLAGGLGVAGIIGLFMLFLHNVRKREQAEIVNKQLQESLDAEHERLATDQVVRNATDDESNSVRDAYRRD